MQSMWREENLVSVLIRSIHLIKTNQNHSCQKPERLKKKIYIYMWAFCQALLLPQAQVEASASRLPDPFPARDHLRSSPAPGAGGRGGGGGRGRAGTGRAAAGSKPCPRRLPAGRRGEAGNTQINIKKTRCGHTSAQPINQRLHLTGSVGGGISHKN